MARTSKTVRLSDEIIEMIEAQAGDNFTAKFEALVTRCMWELPKKEQELKGIQERINEERNNLRYIQQKKHDLIIQTNRMEVLASAATRELKRCIEGLENIQL